MGRLLLQRFGKVQSVAPGLLAGHGHGHGGKMGSGLIDLVAVLTHHHGAAEGGRDPFLVQMDLMGVFEPWLLD